MFIAVSGVILVFIAGYWLGCVHANKQFDKTIGRRGIEDRG